MQASRFEVRMRNFANASGQPDDGKARGPSALPYSPPFKLWSGSFRLGLSETLKGVAICVTWR